MLPKVQKADFKVLRSQNHYHPYHPPVLTSKATTYRYKTRLAIPSTYKQFYPLYYRSQYLQSIGFTPPNDDDEE